MPIQQMLLGVGGAKKTYMDDVFSTHLHTGNSSNQTINNGVDNTKGGLVWFKARSQASVSHALVDTKRGAGKKIYSDLNVAEGTYDQSSYALSAFTSTGFSLKDDDASNCFNQSGITYSTWNFRSAKGFFDVVTWTGDGSSNRQISHSLSSIPGLIIVKKTSESDNWNVYHRSAHATSPEDYRLFLNTSAAASTNDSVWNETKPTSSNFTVGSNDQVNGNGKSYVAYVFAGGESTAATARSVDFDGSNDYLLVGSSSDFTMGTGDFTVEGWIKYDSISHKGVFQITDESDGFQSSNHNDSIALGLSGSATGSTWRIYGGGGSGTVTTAAQSIVAANQWYHFAYVRSSGVTKLYINGTEVLSKTDTHNYNGTYLNIGGYYDQSSYTFDGKLSNFRVVKGTAVYTSSFRPPTEPLANITNTKLLCCNNSSETGSTVTPTTITVQETGSEGITASSDSPFDDPAGFVFGDAGDQNVIKCGSYVGNGNANGPEINLGWEPQWIIVKRFDTQDNKDWYMWDSMRGIVSGGNDKEMQANLNNAEASAEKIELTPTGFKLKSASSTVNYNGGDFTYMTIRRPDGYVGKPPELGTDVFAMTAGNGSSTIPSLVSNFPVDFFTVRQPATSNNWVTSARLMEKNYISTNLNSAETALANATFDSNSGAYAASWINSTYQGWLWKRHAGFDVVTYAGSNSNRLVPHSLNAVPEMIWVKNRGSAEEWAVYHKGLNGGTNPEQYFIELNNTGAETDSSFPWNDTAHSSTHFSLGVYARVNNNWENYIAMLFASVDGISKVGSYSGSSSNVSVTTGFAPRFIIIKRITTTAHWAVFDTVRGINSSGSGGDYLLYLNDNMAGTDANGMIGTWIDLSSTGFTVGTSWAGVNAADSEYIYYAHA